VSRRILKFEVPPGLSGIGTADEPRFLTAGWQGETLVVWAEATVGTGVQTLVYGAVTGEAAPDDAEYVGTAQHTVDGHPFVAHVYRKARP
jgi:hypothetical protein